MSTPLIVGGVLVGIAVVAAGATAAYQYSNASPYAEVVSVTPAMQTVSGTREDCRDEVTTHTREARDPNNIAGSVAGAVVGGVIGHQFGSGSGNDAATVGGSVAGGYAGNRIQNSMQEKDTYETTANVCKPVETSTKEQVGYDVTYRLDGEEHELRMDYDPGKRIPVANGELVLKN